MKEPEKMPWENLRTEALSHLQPGFSRRVLHRAGAKRRQRQVSRWALLTMVTLFVAINAGAWWKYQEEEKQQLAQLEDWQQFQENLLSSL